MSRPSSRHERYRAACHEAGHGVAAIVMDWPFRYATLRPRRADAVGQVLWAPNAWRVTRSGRWEPELMVYAAGPATEDLAVGGDPERRRDIARRNAHTVRADLLMLRVGCRHVWHHVHNPEHYPGDAELRPSVDPAWTVADIAGHAWRRAVELVWERWPAILEAADALQASSRALTQADLRRIVASTPVTTPQEDEEWGEALTDADLEFWPGRYSRLAWRPFPPSAMRMPPARSAADLR
jgi:hypothetical protein